VPVEVLGGHRRAPRRGTRHYRAEHASLALLGTPAADRLAAMEFLYNVFVFLHFASWALVFGGSIASMRTKALYKGVSHGAMGAVVAGVIMVGIAEMGGLWDDGGPSMAKIGVKLVIALAVAVLAVIAVRKGEDVSKGLKGAVLGLTLVNILVAVFWN
jgi:hypothetical protein